MADQSVSSVLEFGCGDGQQLARALYPRYTGLDVAPTAISLCANRFRRDPSKSFFLYEPHFFVNHGALVAELVISLDVVLHLVEDELFDLHLGHVFSAATRFVGIYNREADPAHRVSPHNRPRRTIPWIESNARDWQLIEVVKNPTSNGDAGAQFFFYGRTRG